MNQTLTFTVNGQKQRLTTNPARPLLEVLREDLNLTGTKYGCGEGECRACTVLIDGEPVASCTTPVSAADNKNVSTIEGVAKGEELHPVQRALVEGGGFQCGYCTPGMVMGAIGFLQRRPKATGDELVDALRRHMCRCCNYPKLTKALLRAGVGSNASKP